MNLEYESNSEGDYRTAIAAAAFAVKSFEDQTRKGDQSFHLQGQEEYSFPTTDVTQPRRRLDKFSDDVTKPISNNARNRFMQPSVIAREKSREKTPFNENADYVTTKPTFGAHDEIAQSNAVTREIPQEKRPSTFVPSLRKKLSFGETTLITSQPEQALPAEENMIGTIPSIKMPTTSSTSRRESNKRQETSEANMDTPVPRKLPLPSTTTADTKMSENQGARDTEADEWEKLEMSRVKDKYEKLSTTILDWESKKKSKAKSQLDKAEPGKRRAKAVQRYRNEVDRIQKIAEGARSQAMENRRNEELKVREKANKLRLTGELPSASTCLCC